MKKTIYAITFFICFSIIFTSCASIGSAKYTKMAKEYIEEYYENFNNQNITQCYYQLNKNSSDMLEENYGIDAEDLLASRAKILGTVEGYEIISQEYSKADKVRYIDYEILVTYKNAIVNENLQISIQKDGQTSINTIEFEADTVIDTIIDTYKTALIENNYEDILALMSDYYFTIRTERNLENMIDQANSLGDKLWGCEVVEESYMYEDMDTASYVYEALIEMSYENAVMANKIIISEQNGELAIGYTVILPEEILSFFEYYIYYLDSEDKDNTMSLYYQEIFDDSQDKIDSKWEKLLTYKEAYGDLLGYEVLSFGVEDITLSEETQVEVLIAEAVFYYSNQEVTHKLTLIEDENGNYVIFEQYISDD